MSERGVIRVRRKISPRLFKAVKKCLPHDKAWADGVSLIFVSAAKMAEFNQEYRRRSGATNILTFETGDIVLCPAVIAREAKSLGFTQKKWMTRLMVHGILHLAGYDHESKKETREMEVLEDKILSELGV